MQIKSIERVNGRGRRVFCSAFKAWVVEQTQLPGGSVASLAMRNQVNANQLRRWVVQHRRRADGASPVLLPVTIAPQLALPTPTTRTAVEHGIEIEMSGASDLAPVGVPILG